MWILFVPIHLCKQTQHRPQGACDYVDLWVCVVVGLLSKRLCQLMIKIVMGIDTQGACDYVYHVRRIFVINKRLI